MSGLVQLHETFNEILSRLKSEGFYYKDDNTPYSRSSDMYSETLRVGTRLTAYPDVDFACCTNDERVR